MITSKIKEKIDSVVDYSFDLRSQSWAKEDFKKLIFTEKHLSPKTNTAISNFGAEITAFIMFAEEFKKENNDKSIINRMTFNEYIDHYRNDFVSKLSVNDIKKCGDNYGGVYLLLKNVTDVIHKFTIPTHVVVNCNEFVDELMKLNYLQLNIIQGMFHTWDYNWTLSNFFTQPDNISKGEQPNAYGHFFNELTDQLRKVTGLTMKDYININLNSVDYNSFIHGGPFKTIASQVACYKLGNRGEGLIESAIFREVDVYSLALQLGPEKAVNILITLAEHIEEYIKENNHNRRINCEKAYKKVTIPQHIIDSIIIDENRGTPLDWSVELHMDELKEEILNQYNNIIN